MRALSGVCFLLGRDTAVSQSLITPYLSMVSTLARASLRLAASSGTSATVTTRSALRMTPFCSALSIRSTMPLSVSVFILDERIGRKRPCEPYGEALSRVLLHLLLDEKQLLLSSKERETAQQILFLVKGDP